MKSEKVGTLKKKESKKVGIQKNYEILKSRNSEKVGNLKVGNQKKVRNQKK